MKDWSFGGTLGRQETSEVEAIALENKRLRGAIVRLIRDWWRGHTERQEARTARND